MAGDIGSGVRGQEHHRPRKICRQPPPAQRDAAEDFRAADRGALDFPLRPRGNALFGVEATLIGVSVDRLGYYVVFVTTGIAMLAFCRSFTRAT